MKAQLLGLSMIWIALSFGCSQKVAFQTMPVVPATKVDAKVTRDTNNNARIRLDIKHLAPPNRLTPRKSTYTVWAQTPSGRTINLGRLRVKKNRSAKFETVTPLEKFRILITAEDVANAIDPSQHVVLGTEIFDVKKNRTRWFSPFSR
jgi:hypothetical protein